MPTVKDCKHCGLPSGSSMYCNDKCAQNFRRSQDVEHYRQRARDLYKKHQEKRKKQSLAWYHANKDVILAKKKLRKEIINKQFRDRYATDPEFRDKIRAKSDSREWTFSEHLSREDIKAMRLEDCFYCGGPGGCVDHLVPVSKGGEDRRDNLVPACRGCNAKKYNLDLQEYYARNPIALC